MAGDPFVAMLRSAAAEAPRQPGVYAFLTKSGLIRYVGKATCLPDRLRQHAAATDPRSKARRRGSTAVRWMVLPDEPAAAALEADIIVTLRPSANAWTDSGKWAYVSLEPLGGDRWRWTMDDQPGEEAYGSFPHLGKGVGLSPAVACSDGYAALLRIVWGASGDGSSPPAGLCRSAPVKADVRIDPALLPGVMRLLEGASPAVLPLLLRAAGEREPFVVSALRRDLAGAEAFYRLGPARLRERRLRHGLGDGPIDRTKHRGLIAADAEPLSRRPT